MERESEEPGRGSAIEDMNLEGPEGGADDWDKTITITYDPALDCSRGDRFAETPADGEPLQPGGEQENRISASTGGVASGGAEDAPGAIHAPAQASGIGASVNSAFCGPAERGTSAEGAAGVSRSPGLSRSGTQRVDFCGPAEAGTPAGSGAIDGAKQSHGNLCGSCRQRKPAAWA